jgi:hypothetical protein
VECRSTIGIARGHYRPEMRYHRTQALFAVKLVTLGFRTVYLRRAVSKRKILV